jgi:hypothetical protein
MALDRKTPFNVVFYDHEQDEINSWQFKGSARLALIINTITSRKNEIETNNINKEDEIKKALDHITYEIKKFIETPYTTKDNA